MPAAVWPSFHCRPSTTNTLLPPSLSMRQTPTTLTKDFGSAPTVSSEKSSFTDFAVTGRAALVRTAVVRILDLAVGVLARTADHALTARDEANRDVRHNALELGQHVAPQIDIARVLRNKVNRDHQGLAQLRERP